MTASTGDLSSKSRVDRLLHAQRLRYEYAVQACVGTWVERRREGFHVKCDSGPGPVEAALRKSLTSLSPGQHVRSYSTFESVSQSVCVMPLTLALGRLVYARPFPVLGDSDVGSSCCCRLFGRASALLPLMRNPPKQSWSFPGHPPLALIRTSRPLLHTRTHTRRGYRERTETRTVAPT